MSFSAYLWDPPWQPSLHLKVPPPSIWKPSLHLEALPPAHTHLCRSHFKRLSSSIEIFPLWDWKMGISLFNGCTPFLCLQEPPLAYLVTFSVNIHPVHLVTLETSLR